MPDLNGAFCLNTKPFCVIALFPVTPRSNVPFTSIYPSLKAHKSDLRTAVLNLIFLLVEY